METIRGKTLQEWKDYSDKDKNIPIRTVKYITVLEERIEQLTIHVVTNCGVNDRPDGLDSSEWWCTKCGEIVPCFDATNDKRHGIEGCLTKLC